MQKQNNYRNMYTKMNITLATMKQDKAICVNIFTDVIIIT